MPGPRQYDKVAPAVVAPALRGPLGVTPASAPFRSCLARASSLYVDLGSLGYVEEEFLLRGTADVVDVDDRVVAPARPYTTRVLVRRPADTGRFSGSTHIEPFHHLMEDTPHWTAAHRYVTSNGDAWVGVTVASGADQPAAGRSAGGATKLRAFDATRYGGVELTSLLPPGAVAPPPASDASTFDFVAFQHRMRRSMPQAFGVLEQVAALLRGEHGPIALLGGPRAQRVYAGGWSQTGQLWREHLDLGHHESHRRADGGPLFDGYLVAVGPRPVGRASDAVIVHLLSETEVVGTLRPPDTVDDDTDDPRFRAYEVAGSFHYWQAKPKAGRNAAPASPDHAQHNDRPWWLVIHALLAGQDRWVSDATPMLHAGRIVRDPSAGDGIARDRHGNALGGLRTPWVDVPSAQFLPRCSCSPVVGAMRPFSDEELERTYGSRTAYAERFRSRAAELAAQGWLLPEDLAGLSPP